MKIVEKGLELFKESEPLCEGHQHSASKSQSGVYSGWSFVFKGTHEEVGHGIGGPGPFTKPASRSRVLSGQELHFLKILINFS